MAGVLNQWPLEDLPDGMALTNSRNDFPKLCRRRQGSYRSVNDRIIYSPIAGHVFVSRFATVATVPGGFGGNFTERLGNSGYPFNISVLFVPNPVPNPGDFPTGGTLTVSAGLNNQTIFGRWTMAKVRHGWKTKYGSPLADDRDIDVLADAYSSTGFLNFGKGNSNFGHTGFLNFGHTGFLNFGHTGFLNFGTSDNVYGSVGFIDLGNEETTALDFGSSQSALPPSLQARGQLYPMLKRIKLANAKQPGKEVWQFSTCGRTNIFLDVAEKSLDASELAEDKPHTWYLLEDPGDVAADPYVLGIGRKAARVHVPGSAIVLTIINESDLFTTDMLLKPVKERAARAGAESTSNLSGKKLKTVVQELAFKVSYKTIRTMMRRVAPEGVDPTVKIKVRFEAGEVREVRLVLYAVHKKNLPMLGTIGEGRITHMVAVWTENEELAAAFWASTGETLDNALGLIHDVTVWMQKGELVQEEERVQEGEANSVVLIEALLDIETPTQRFNHVPGEYGAAVREAVIQDFGRHKKASSADAVGDISTDVIGLLADAAYIAVGEGIKGLKGLFGAAQEEEYEEDSEVSAPTVKALQPYTKITGVYDQRPYSSCVLCSIGAAMSMVEGIHMKEVYKALSKVIIPEKVPSQGLIMRDTLKKLEPLFEKHGQLQWQGISTAVDSLKKALDAGMPVIVGTKFDGGILNYSSSLDTPLSGPVGLEMMHCVTLVAYDDADSTFTLLNSWGPKWGRNGAMIVEQDYAGFCRAFVIFRKGSSSFGAVDIAPNLASIDFKEPT